MHTGSEVVARRFVYVIPAFRRVVSHRFPTSEEKRAMDRVHPTIPQSARHRPVETHRACPTIPGIRL